MQLKNTTVVVLPYSVGEKYNRARARGIPCVTPNWVFDSMAAKRLCSFSDYEPSSGVSGIVIFLNLLSPWVSVIYVALFGFTGEDFRG